MRILKKIIFVLFGIIALILIAALFVKKEYAVEREVVIKKPSSEVFSYVKLMKNQDNFSVWSQVDPAMKKDLRGIDGTVGAVSTWDSTNKDVGKGEQEIKKIIEGERIDFELRFLKPFESTDSAYITTRAINPTHTEVKWGFNGKMSYPMNLMLPFMDMEGMLGDALQQGLNNLKTTLEKE